MRKYLVLSVVLAGAAAVAAWFLTGADAEDGGLPPAEFDLAEGEALYQEGCAVCHGVNLEGQPDWRSPGPDGRLPAPPHSADGHTWHHPDSVLFAYTKQGGREALKAQGMDFDSGMPGFGVLYTDQQIWNILAYIKSTWPDRERELQAARSEADRQR